MAPSLVIHLHPADAFGPRAQAPALKVSPAIADVIFAADLVGAAVAVLGAVANLQGDN